MPGKKRCKLHGGASPGAAKGNTNAVKHGAYRSRGGVLAALPPEERARVEGIEIDAAHEEAIKLEAYLLRRAVEALIQAEEHLEHLIEMGLDDATEDVKGARAACGMRRKGCSLHAENLSKMALRHAQGKAVLIRAGLDEDKTEADKVATARTIHILEQIRESRR